MKTIIALLLAVTACAVHAAEEPDVYPCLARDGYNALYCNGGIIGYERVIYKDANGNTRVSNEIKSYQARCRDEVCSSLQGDYVGAGDNGEYTVRRDYYLSWGSDGKVYAYRNGTGPGFGGPVYTPTAAPASAGEICYEEKLADYRKENGEDAMVIMDQIHEWQTQCGLPISY
ncbi:hypothetical protein DBO86_12650 [Pseudomonas indoloxydans]|uniref:DUF4124 domain-containing protein n=1 Tax=Ectopseudomonas oleovorans TaxID=301 RepID=A0A2T5PLS1_ECTOL|nr:hypothetical protein [Pseudomonas indoloxydans]PTU78705.1 hypothetical protein DBO86_12650 [Pseudomonas indoloxydans]